MAFQTVEEAFGYLESFTNLEQSGDFSHREYRLDRMRFLLALFGNPQNSFQSIHLAGSKGKGSTAMYIASILKAYGYKTGLYSSPHVASYTERINLAGTPFSAALYIDTIEKIRKEIEALDQGRLPTGKRPTTFELLTLTAFLVFSASGCHWAVIETGLGGRLDATNVIDPAACVLTPVELEHTEWLGDTLEKIAGEKAGIIKAERPVFCGFQKEAVRTVFAARAASRGAPFYYLPDQLESFAYTPGREGSRVQLQWKGSKPPLSFRLQMLGEYQGENAALAAYTVAHIEGVQGSGEKLVQGLERATLPGRSELLKFPLGRGKSVTVFLDGAHTPSSTERLLKTIESLQAAKSVLIFGSILGKDAGKMAAILAPAFGHIIISRPGSFKKSDPDAVFKEFSKVNPRCQLVPDPREAFGKALELLEPGELLLVTGSFYMVAEIRRYVVAGS